MQKRVVLPYTKPKGNIWNQIRSGSSRRNENPVVFLFRKLFNFSLAILAYNCPFNSWRVKFHRWRGVNIGKHVTIGLHVTLDHSYPKYITIEDDVTLSGENYILTHSTPKIHWKNVAPSYIAPVIIKRGAWLTLGVTVLPGITIGSYSIISAGSIVNKDIPSKVIASGNPIRVVRKIDIGLVEPLN